MKRLGRIINFISYAMKITYLLFKEIILMLFRIEDKIEEILIKSVLGVYKKLTNLCSYFYPISKN